MGMQERRSARRSKLALPVEIAWAAPPRERRLRGKTRDLSTRGIYFTLGETLAPDTKFQFSVVVPAEMTGGTEVVITARARVVRAEKRAARTPERFGIGAVIEKCETIITERESGWA